MSFWVRFAGVRSVLDGTDDLIDVVLADDAVWVIANEVPYAAYVELGTSKMEAQPHLGPVSREVREEVPAILARAESVEHAVELTAKRVVEKLQAPDSPVPVDTGRLKAGYHARQRR